MNREAVQTTIAEHNEHICNVYYPTVQDYYRYRHTVIKQIQQHKKYKTVHTIAHHVDGSLRAITSLIE